MQIRSVSVASVIASLMISGGIAVAADLPVRMAPAEPAPIFTTVSGYVEAGLGIGWQRNTLTSTYAYGDNGFDSYRESGSDQKWSIEGAGRVNVWMAPNFSVQTDVWGSGDSTKIKNCTGCGSASDTSFNIGTHLSYRDPNAFLVGAYGALGNFNRSSYSSFGLDGARTGTLGLEGQVYFGATTVYGQLGYASTIGASDNSAANAWNARAVLRHYFNPNMRLSGEIGYVHMKSDTSSEDTWRARQVHWGVGLEHKFGASPFSAFLKYEGSDTKATASGVGCCPTIYTESFKTTSHAVKAGVRIYFGEGTLLANDRTGTTLDIRDPISSVSRGMGRNLNSLNIN